MTLTLELPPEKEARLRQKAQAQGIAVEDYAIDALMQTVDETAPAADGRTLAEALVGLIGVVDSGKHNGGKASHAAENSGEVFGEILLEKHKAGHL